MDTKLKSKDLSNSKFWSFIKRIVILVIISTFLFSILIFHTISKLKSLNFELQSRKNILVNAKKELNSLKQYDNINSNINLIDYNFWLNKCASPSNLTIYKDTNNLKILSEKTQDELNKISKDYKIINNNDNYNNVVKFIIIDKSKGTFLTNDIEHINFIKSKISTFSKENGEFFNYVSRNGTWYNLSYDAYNCPAHSYDIENPKNFVQAYWFPKHFAYSKEDKSLLIKIFNSLKENASENIRDSENNIKYINIEVNRNTTYLVLYFISIIILIYFLYFLGKENIIIGLKNSYIYRLINSVSNWFQQKSTLFKIISYNLLTLLILFIITLGFNKTLIIFFPYIFIYFVFILPSFIKFLNYIDEIIKGSNEITNGNLNYVIEEKGDIKLSQLANNINKINKGFKVSIDEQIKNEKLKSQLVANVSHDLKTPLTSIINSTDILLREDVSEEEKQEYLQILHKKSLKLKKLIEDLFEISKINSGKMKLNRENVDVVELINQSIAEYSDTEMYSNKNLNFIVKPFSEDIIMNLDGNKMSRVFENLINNTLKYSLPSTRVYVNIENIDNGIKIIFKNVSADPLDFDKKEIFERFSRGDNSRNSTIPGNGLGLAIAKSIVELHTGNMYVDFDGDLFKSIIELYY